MQIEIPNPNQPAPSLLDKLASWSLVIICLVWVSLGLLVVIFTMATLISDSHMRHIRRSNHPSVRFDSASFTSLDDAVGPNLRAKFDISFIITNPSKKYNISYNVIVVSLNKGGGCGHDYHHNIFCRDLDLLAFIRLPPFLQLNRSENALRVQINVVDQFVGNNIIASRARGTIDFGLKLYAQYSSAVDEDTMYFYCKHLSFVFNTNNTTSALGTCLSNPEVYFLP